VLKIKQNIRSIILNLRNLLLSIVNFMSIFTKLLFIK
jgi:hypothetical protein